jgi:Bacterial Ig-like domain (group 1)
MTAVSLRPALRLLAVFALSVSAATACSHDSSNTTGVSSNGFTLAIDSGSNLQIAVVGHTIHVTVVGTSSTGGTVSNLTATWIVESGGGTISASSTVTDGSGKTSVDWTLGTTSGTQTLTASITGVAVTISATAAPDVMRGLIKASLDSQTVVSTASTSFTVRAVDQYNNPVPGIVVNWTANAGTLSAASTTTGDSGNAQVSFTTNAIPTHYTITAATAGFAPVTFTLTGS